MEYKLDELIDINKLELLLDKFCNLTALTVAIFDLEGKMLLAAGSRELCCQLQGKPMECLACCENEDVYQPELIKTAFAINVDNKYLADMLVGQSLIQNPDSEGLSTEKIEYSLNFLVQLVEMFSDRGFIQLRQKQKEEFLAEDNRRLEKSVLKCTGELARVSSDLKQEIWRREQVEQALRESETRLQLILENMPIIMEALDENLNIVFFNHEGERVTGYSAAEIVNNPNAFALRYPDEEYRRYVMQEAKELEFNYYGVETKVTCKDGSVKTIAWFNISNRFPVSGWESWAFGVDVTEHKRIEDELRKAASELRTIFEAVPDLYFRFSKEGVFLDSKVGNAHDLYILQSEFLGKKVQDVLPLPVGRQFFLAIQKALHTKSPVIIEYALLFSEDERFFEARLAPFADQVIALVHNITERKHREAEMMKIEKLESIGILAAGIAHDFNNILTAIMGNVSLAEMYVEKGSKAKVANCLQEAKRASTQARDLSGQLLTFAKGGSPILKTVSIAELIRHCANFVLCGSKVRCSFELSEDIYPVNVDAGQISQVINNLIINAQQAMPNGGKIKVIAENIESIAEENLPLENGRYVKIMINDNGTGIPAEYLTKIFDPYFTTKPNGNGLGLATVYSIIKKHNGYITVDSKQNVGTTFFIYLPASDIEFLASSKKRVRLHDTKGKVLVMDDEQMVRDVVGEMLNLLECEVVFAADGQTAIELYQQACNNNCPFDVVLMDLTVPGGMGGEEALKELKKIDPQVKAIVSSGYADAPIIAHYQEYGFQGFVAKPYNIEELSETLRKVMNHTSKQD